MKYENLSKKIQMSVNEKSSMDVKNLKIMSFPKSTTFFVVRKGIAFVLGLTLVVGGTFYLQKQYIDHLEAKAKDTNIVQYDDSYSNVGTEKIFQVGEHVVKIPLGDKTIEEIRQYDAYEAYKLDGIFEQNTESAYIKYVNIQPVKCNASHYDEKGNYLYLDFGSPVELENLKTR